MKQSCHKGFPHLIITGLDRCLIFVLSSVCFPASANNVNNSNVTAIPITYSTDWKWRYRKWNSTMLIQFYIQNDWVKQQTALPGWEPPPICLNVWYSEENTVHVPRNWSVLLCLISSGKLTEFFHNKNTYFTINNYSTNTERHPHPPRIRCSPYSSVYQNVVTKQLIRNSEMQTYGYQPFVANWDLGHCETQVWSKW